MQWNRINTFMIMLLLFIFIFLIFVTFFPEDCKEDRSCFDKKAFECVRSSYTYINEGNIYSYSIIGSTFNNSCKMQILLEKVSETSSLDTKNKFEGKSMECIFSRNLLAASPILETNNLLTYCSGPLKEATLELMIEKLYGTIAQNLGPIINQVGNSDFQDIISNAEENIIVTNGSIG